MKKTEEEKQIKQHEKNLLRSELCVAVHIAINNFNSTCVPGRKVTKEDIVNVLTSIASSKTS
jgi:hypothetical protein